MENKSNKQSASIEDKTEAEQVETSKKTEQNIITIDLDEETRRLLNVRKKQKSKKPTFKQTDSHKKKKLADYWRKPDGMHNKTRYSLHGKCPLVEAGYGSPAAVRGLHPSGFQEVLVKNPEDIESLKTDKQAARIGRTVGSRKRVLIEKKAADMGLKILNPTRREE